jgi:hypothetical protein
MLAGDLPGGFMALLQNIKDNAQARQQWADERAESQEARLEAQMAALSAAHLIPARLVPAATDVSTGFKYNPLKRWHRSRGRTGNPASRHCSQDDAMNELRLKLVGAPSSRYLEAFCGDDARPTILEVLACLA